MTGRALRGDFKADKRDGHGTYYWASGDVYSGPWKDDQVARPATSMTRAYAKFQDEAKRAVERIGQTVCRRMPVGIALHEWLRGEVVAIGPQGVAIRIDDPGHYCEAIGGAALKKGNTVWGAPQAWLPCR